MYVSVVMGLPCDRTHMSIRQVAEGDRSSIRNMVVLSSYTRLPTYDTEENERKGGALGRFCYTLVTRLSRGVLPFGMVVHSKPEVVLYLAVCCVWVVDGIGKG